MKKWTASLLLVCTIALLLASAVLVGAQEPERPSRFGAITIHPVAGPVRYLEGRGGNIGVSAGPDGVLLVDDQFLRSAQDIEAAIASFGAGVPRFVLNTHWHRDHTEGNAHFGRGATVVAHANVRRRLTGEAGIEGSTANWEVPPHALPTITFEDGLALHFNGEEIRVLHLPGGHTDGDSIVWFRGSNVVHLGDLFFAGAFPFVDLDSGGSVEGVIANVERVLALLPEGAQLIPGHGPLSDAALLVEYRDMLREVVRRVRAALAQGSDAAAMRQAGLLDDLAARWEPAGAFVDRGRMIDTLARELGR